ncbi:MAG TPA: YceI family protein [Candidatus Eisenbacteria bacterium]|nr:YceI family protein [Candidatus Eisenbacteria bacterium]
MDSVPSSRIAFSRDATGDLAEGWRINISGQVANQLTQCLVCSIARGKFSQYTLALSDAVFKCDSPAGVEMEGTIRESFPRRDKPRALSICSNGICLDRRVLDWMSRSRKRRRCTDLPLTGLCLLLGAVLTPLSALAQQVAIDTAHSLVTVRVYKSGLFSALAHNHVIRAPIAAGSLDASARVTEIAFNVTDMKVVDPEGSDSERKEIEETMKGPTVLDMAKFPAIRFRSQTITEAGPNKDQVTGELRIHGVARQVSFPVIFSDGKYSGSVPLKQTDFGITPIKIAGGTVRVKDEIVVEFSVVPTTPSSASAKHP